MTHSLTTLAKLAETIAARRGASPETSYTAKLLHKGVDRCAKKFGEEAVELVIAAMEREPRHITAEAADVLYHFLVLLTASGVSIDEVMAELAARESQSGLSEKASRKDR
jgi:phosphoribosyl-ATP pyrophosphohydrolase